MYSEYKENEKERNKEIARKYNGKWKLTGCFNNVEFYKKIGKQIWFKHFRLHQYTKH